MCVCARATRVQNCPAKPYNAARVRRQRSPDDDDLREFLRVRVRINTIYTDNAHVHANTNANTKRRGLSPRGTTRSYNVV